MLRLNNSKNYTIINNIYTIVPVTCKEDIMHWKKEFLFFSNILKNMNLTVSCLQSPEDLKPFSNCLTSDSTNTIYRIRTSGFYFLFFRLPDTQPASYISIGPYVVSSVFAEKETAPQTFSPGIPVLTDESALFTIVNTFGELLWGTLDNFSFQNIETPAAPELNPTTESQDMELPRETLLSIQLMEEYYDCENELLKLVSQGQWNATEIFLNRFFALKKNYSVFPWENTLEWKKAQSIMLNTLLRKAAESADVPPIHIGHLSSHTLERIVKLSRPTDSLALQKDIICKYCHLVQSHSLKGYSPIIQKVMTQITTNLTGNLGLDAQAKRLNVNPSYLSALFKKETGLTLTEYVKRKRINHAVFLLNTSNLQIQTIAQHCGIADVNYFTKMFKKIVGKTPKDYRSEILS